MLQSKDCTHDILDSQKRDMTNRINQRLLAGHQHWPQSLRALISGAVSDELNFFNIELDAAHNRANRLEKQVASLRASRTLAQRSEQEAIRLAKNAIEPPGAQLAAQICDEAGIADGPLPERLAALQVKLRRMVALQHNLASAIQGYNNGADEAAQPHAPETTDTSADHFTDGLAYMLGALYPSLFGGLDTARGDSQASIATCAACPAPTANSCSTEQCKAASAH